MKFINLLVKLFYRWKFITLMRSCLPMKVLYFVFSKLLVLAFLEFTGLPCFFFCLQRIESKKVILDPLNNLIDILNHNEVFINKLTMYKSWRSFHVFCYFINSECFVNFDSVASICCSPR